MTETSTLEAELEQIRGGFVGGPDTARAQIRKTGVRVINAYEVGHMVCSTNAEFVVSSF